MSFFTKGFYKDLSLLLGLAFSVVVLVLFFRQGQLDETRARLDDAERRIGECIDIAADARDNALMSEAAWLRATEELSYCQGWEEWGSGGVGGGGKCVGPEYWTSYNHYVGPGL